MSFAATIPARLRLTLALLAVLCLPDSAADPMSAEPVACPAAAGSRRADLDVHLQGSVPQSFTTGQRVTLCGHRLFNTYEANSASTLPDARMLRIGDWYLPIEAVALSNAGDRLSFTIAAGGPYLRLPASPTPDPAGGGARRYGFVAAPVAGGVITGAIALHSLSSPPDGRRQHSTDVVALTPSVWRGMSIQRRESP